MPNKISRELCGVREWLHCNGAGVVAASACIRQGGA